MPKQTILTVLVVLFSLLAGCSGGSATFTSAFSDEGIGGTGIGTVTGFGSIIINQTREFEVAQTTRLSIDGKTVNEDDFRNAGLGLVVSYQVANDVNADFTRGTLLSLDARHQLRGPITQTQPLTILEQTAQLQPDTVLLDANGQPLSPADLSIGDVVAISGFEKGSSALLATRVQVEDDGAAWKLTGLVSEVVPNASFTIGTQKILLNGVTPEHCEPELSVGDLVEASFIGANHYSAGDTITTLLQVECKQTGLSVPSNLSTPIPSEIEGVLTSVRSETQFIVNGQQILLTGNTQFEGGDATALVPGTFVEVEGALQPDGWLHADKIEIKLTENESEDKKEDKIPESGDGVPPENSESQQAPHDSADNNNTTNEIANPTTEEPEKAEPEAPE